MGRRERWFAGLILAVTASASPAIADLPNPNRSTVDRLLVACPEGDFIFRIVVRDFVGNPRAGATVTLAFGSCPTFTLCVDPSAPYFVDAPSRSVFMTSNSQGIADFPLRMGGTCPDSLVAVYADGILFGRRYLASPDQNGDLGVNDVDRILLESKLGSSDPTADLNGDGSVTAADVGILQAHSGHICPVAVPVAPATWGRLKLLYR